MKSILVVLLALTAAALTADPSIKVGFYEYGFLYSAGKGIDKDIVDLLAKRTGTTFDRQLLARARIWKDIQSGDLDMTVSGIQTTDRSTYAWFIPYLVVKNYTILSNGLSGVKNFDQFLARKELRWGIVTSFRYGAAQDKIIQQLRAEGRVEESPDVEALFRKLKEGRVNGLFSQPLVFKKYLGDLNMTALVDIQDWAPQQKGVPAGLVLSKLRFSEADFHKWQAVFQTMKEDGTLKALYLHYLPAAEATALLDF